MIPINHVVGGFPIAVGPQLITTFIIRWVGRIVYVKFACGNVQSDFDVSSKIVAGFFDGRLDTVERLVVTTSDLWRVATFVADGSRVALFFQNIFESVEDFGTHADGFINRAGRGRNNHVFLEVGSPSGVFTTIHYVHHWHRDRHFFGRAGKLGDIPIERQTFGASGGFSVSQ